VVDKFENLLKKLSSILDTNLKVDSNGACSILFDNLLTVQLQPDDSFENLIIFCPIAQLLAGKFRENVLLSTLKANNKFPYFGIFGYFSKDNSLVFFNYLDFESLNAEFLANYLSKFVDLAFKYQDLISHGQTSLNIIQI